LESPIDRIFFSAKFVESTVSNGIFFLHLIVTEAAFFIPIYPILYHLVLPNRILPKKEKIQKRIIFAEISSDYDHSKIKTEEFTVRFRLLQELLVFVSEALCEF
jgi:hypothetical protein